jgi:hypothetical protein
MLLITQQPFNILHNTENQEKNYIISHTRTLIYQFYNYGNQKIKTCSINKAKIAVNSAYALMVYSE